MFFFEGNNMRLLSIVLVCFFMIEFTGCGGGVDNNVVIKTDYDSAKAIKDALEGVKTSGRLGSGFSGVMNAARELKASNPAKGEAVEKQLNELAALSDAAKVKAKAEEIIKSL